MDTHVWEGGGAGLEARGGLKEGGGERLGYAVLICVEMFGLVLEVGRLASTFITVCFRWSSGGGGRGTLTQDGGGRLVGGEKSKSGKAEEWRLETSLRIHGLMVPLNCQQPETRQIKVRNTPININSKEQFYD